jgi:ElaB/YqjD/DUF883 family membrane-anchored ribosome-binding protein
MNIFSQNSLQLIKSVVHLNCSRGLDNANCFLRLFFWIRRFIKMSEFEQEVKNAEQELNQSLVPVTGNTEETSNNFLNDEFLGDLKVQAQEYQQKLQDAALKAKDFANEKFTQAGDKFKEISAKDPKELVEDAKEFARQKPGQTILISAAVGLVLGLILKGGRK